MCVATEKLFSPSRLADLRLVRGYSQPQFAEAAGVKLGTLRALEQGRIADPKVATVARLAEALGIATDDLLAEPVG